MPSNCIEHHGIKGMRWGIRRYQNPDGSLTEAGKKRYSEVDKWTHEGSRKTKERTSELLKADKRFGPGQRNIFQQRKISKLADKADKSYAEDIKEARSVGHTAAANRLRAGRTYLKVLSDSNFFNAALTDAMVQAKVVPGEDYAWDLLRNDDIGGVTITVNGVASDYIYDRPDD